MKKVLSLLLIIFTILITGCGSSGPDLKKEAQALNQKYGESLNQITLKLFEKVKGIDNEWSEAMAKTVGETKQDFASVAKNIEEEKVSKQVEPYKNALKERFIIQSQLYELSEKQIRLKLANKPDSEVFALTDKTNNEIRPKIRQNDYEIENEYSKIMTGKPAKVMGVNGVNYLAHTASDVDIAVIEGRWQANAVGNNPYLQKKPIGKFIILKVFMKNSQKDAITVDSNSFKLIDNQKREFSSSHEAMLALRADAGDTKGFLTQLNPGMGTDFTIVFDVPMELNQYNTKLVARGGATGKPVMMPINPVKVLQIKQ